MINIVSCLLLVLTYSQISWANSFLAPWKIIIGADPSNLDFSCGGVLVTPNEVLASSACLNTLPQNSQLLLKAEFIYTGMYNQHRIAQSIQTMYQEIAIISVNSFQINSLVQTLPQSIVSICIAQNKIRGDAYAFGFSGTGDVSVTKLNFMDSPSMCRELNDTIIFPANKLCSRLDNNCELNGGGDILVIKDHGMFNLVGFKLFHDCEKNIAVYVTNLCPDS